MRKLNDIIVKIARPILPNYCLWWIIAIDFRELDAKNIELLHQIRFYIKSIEKQEDDIKKYQQRKESDRDLTDVDYTMRCADLDHDKEELRRLIMQAEKQPQISELYEFVYIFSELDKDSYIKKLAFYVDEEKHKDIYKIFRSIAVINDTWYSSKVVSTFTTYKRFINSLIAVYIGLFASTLFSDNNFHNLYFLTVDHIILGLLVTVIIIYIFYSWSFNVGEINSGDAGEARESPEHCSRVALIANDYILKSRPYVTFSVVIILNLMGVFEYVVGFNPHKTTICNDGQLIAELVPYQEFYQCKDIIFIEHVIDILNNTIRIMFL